VAGGQLQGRFERAVQARQAARRPGRTGQGRRPGPTPPRPRRSCALPRGGRPTGAGAGSYCS
jgi:hypothetical protein